MDLSPFAGQDGLKLRFDYEDNSPGRANEGVYVDDLIIGFAERGEMVTGAGPGGQFVGNPDLNPSDLTQGNYQLEIRKSTEFGTSTDLASSGLALHTSYDTNDRLALQTTMIVPDGKNIVDGQTFVVSDGLNSVTFEFDDPSLSNGVVGNNILIPFKSPAAGGGYQADADYVIARRIRDAINSPQMRTRCASPQPCPTAKSPVRPARPTASTCLAQAVMEQSTPFTVTETTNDGNRLRDAILGSGLTAVGNARFAGSGVSAGFFTGGANIIGMRGRHCADYGQCSIRRRPQRQRFLDRPGFRGKGCRPGRRFFRIHPGLKLAGF